MKTTKRKIQHRPKQQLPDWETATQETRQPTEGELSQLSDLSKRMQNLQWKIDQIMGEVFELQKIRDRIAFQDIPELMDKWGISEVRLKDGSRVVVKPFVKASLPTETAITKAKTEDDRELLRDRINIGLAFLKKNGAEALIKNILKVEFGKGQTKKAREAIAALAKIGISAETVQTVHAQTLTAWVRERLAEGKPVDLATFSVYSGNVATVEAPKP
jgi:hypothetical protein